MTGDTEILRRVEEILDSGCAPEDACADAPELLSAVRERLQRIRLLDSHVQELFPTSGAGGSARAPRRMSAHSKLPSIPGYVVERLLGHGGMGIVYKAMHVRLKRPVAIKMMLAGSYASGHDRERFMREAEAIAAIQHPNIVQVHDVGEFDDRLYFTMELVDGGTLAQQLNGVPQPAREAAALLVRLANAVQMAHDRGVVHRDLKPGNVLMSADGTPKITDFGLARRMNGDAALTLTGVRMGTPSYMAPEQVVGGESSMGPAVDVYALGAILYETLTGRPPFRAETASETERQLLAREPVPPSRLNARVPRDIETICLKSLKKNADRRYASARELAADLQRFLNHEPILARRAGHFERGIRWMWWHPKETALITATALLLLIAVSAGAREWNRVIAQRAEMARWVDRLVFINGLQREGRFDEARLILGRVPDGGSDVIRDQIEQTKRDLDTIERLDAIRLERGTFVLGGGIDYDQCAQAYATAFGEDDRGTFDDRPESVAAALTRSPVNRAIVAALDDWSACAMGDERAWVLQVARSMDPDPWRDRVRDQANWANLDHLAALAETVEVERQPVTIMVAMGTRWRRLGGDPTAFLQRVQRQYPDDFWVNFELAHLLSLSDPVASLSFSRAALTIRPNSAVARYNLGQLLSRMGMRDEATHHFQRVLAVVPDHTDAHRALAASLLAEEQYEQAIEHLDRAEVLERDHPLTKFLRIRAYVAAGRIEALRAHWAELIAAEPAQHGPWDGYAELCLHLGDTDEYERVCGELLQRFGESTDPHICERTGRACLLAAGNQRHFGQANKLIDRALAADSAAGESWARPYFIVAKALAEYRAERYGEVIEHLRDEQVMSALTPMPSLLLAMALHQAGSPHEARQALSRAIELFDWSETKADSREAWMYHILRREAEVTIGIRHE